MLFILVKFCVNHLEGFWKTDSERERATEEPGFTWATVADELQYLSTKGMEVYVGAPIIRTILYRLGTAVKLPVPAAMLKGRVGIVS